MAQSGRITAEDLRAAFALVGECRELGADFTAWREHFQAGLARLAGAETGIGSLSSAATPDGRMDVLATVGVGWPSPDAARAWHDFSRGAGHNRDPVVRRLAAAGLALGVWTRRQGAGDREWYGSGAYNELCRPFGLDDALMSRSSLPGGGMDWVVLFRERGARPFPARSRALLGAVHAEVARLVGRPLAGPSEPSPSGLSPRQREALALLLRGATDKAIARGLGVRPSTAHQYVLAILQHFGVRSRPELLAFFLGRGRHAPDGPGGASPGDDPLARPGGDRGRSGR